MEGVGWDRCSSVSGEAGRNTECFEAGSPLVTDTGVYIGDRNGTFYRFNLDGSSPFLPYIHIFTYVYIFIYVCVYICICICIYVYIYTSMYIYVMLLQGLRGGVFL